MGFDVFIVHAAPDKDTALRLRDALAQTGVRAFVDRPDTPPGAPWDTTIERELRESLLQVVLLGEDTRWYQHEEVDLAIREMRAHGARDRIVPVLLTPTASLPYGLNRVQALPWDGPIRVAARLAEKVAVLRGAHMGGGVTGATTQRRVRIAVLGLRDELAGALETLHRRIGQRTSILDGDVALIDLARDDLPDVDLRVVLLRRRHAGQLALIQDLVNAAAQAWSQTGPAKGNTIVGAIDVTLRQVPASDRSEAREMEPLLLDVPITASSDQAVIDQLDEQVARWYATCFPSRPGMSITRERWEERYLEDKAPLWRKGDPSALRSLGGARVDRVRWYVHLKAESPWVDVAGEIRWKLQSLQLSLPLDPRRSTDDVQSSAVPALLWWLEPPRSVLPFGGGDEVTSSPDHGAVAAAWLDRILSHRLLPRCVVVGSAGTGKTVLLQHLAWVLATSAAPQLNGETVHRVDRTGVCGDSPVPPLPILHTASTLVAHLRGDRPIREALVALLRSSETFGDLAEAATVRAGIDAGRYVFLIDSLDEVPRRQDREALVAALGTLTGPAPRVVLTTRPSAHTEVDLPDGFVRVDIAPLDEGTVVRLTRAWLACWAPAEDIKLVLRAIDHMLHHFPAQSHERSPVQNPLLLSCILQVYALYRRLPDDTAKLYHDMVRVLCEAKIRAADDLERDSLVERYREALRELCLATQELGGTQLGVAAAWDLLVKRGLAARGTADSWLQALANHTGLIRFEGIGDEAVIRPWHRSYQEYLAAEKIALDYANRAPECIAWLRAPRFQRGPRLTDPVWRGTLRFLIGAAAHHHRAWGMDLIDATTAAAAERKHDQARLYALAVEAAAEYANSLFRNETLRQTLPEIVNTAFTDDGAGWPVAERVTVLHALGRLGDPRLPDPRLRSGPPVGWLAVPPGTYKIGVEPATFEDEASRGEPGAGTNQRTMPDQTKPGGWQHTRLLPLATSTTGGFWIRRWPVTVAEFLPFVNDPPSDLVLPTADIDWSYLVPGWLAQARYPTRPIVEVSWHVARAFCRWAQRYWQLPCDGVIDLPTSAEWEIAARRHTDRIYPWGNEPPGEGDNAAAAFNWKIDRLDKGATPVGAFPRGHTPEGLWDMGGNVFEWCASNHAGREGLAGTGDHDLPIDRSDPFPPGEKVYRGGSWRHDATTLSVAYRGDSPPSMISEYVGFRVICCPRLLKPDKL